jgi:adenine-specific DNA-methyltransferase
MTSKNSDYDVALDLEEQRLALQSRLDSLRTPDERNRLGQFATPSILARDFVNYSIDLTEVDCRIRFLDPAIGTGAFFSALMKAVPPERVEKATGFEIDPHYGEPSRILWQGTELDLKIADFTKAVPPITEENRYNLLICNPPYVRHHHLTNGEKLRLQEVTTRTFGNRITGLAGLYCYFLGLAHPWLRRGAIAGWLIPTEFLDVNYGEAIKRYLLNKVTLLRIHRFDSRDLQFEDALVSSALVWFRNALPPEDHAVEFTFGQSLLSPSLSRHILTTELRQEAKWSRFPQLDVRDQGPSLRLFDLFTIKRGIATGANHFFILNREQIKAERLPEELFRPILPSPRYLTAEEIEADQDGNPLVVPQLFLLDCRLSEAEVARRHPKLWEYLQKGKDSISARYLCRSRKVWYFQEKRAPAPLLCTYLGRRDSKHQRPFRFLLNHSTAIAANVYLLLYPKPILARALLRDKALLRRIWTALNNLTLATLLEEGRVYGGGLYKLEPKELANVDATLIAELAPEVIGHVKPTQLQLLETPSRYESE